MFSKVVRKLRRPFSVFRQPSTYAHKLKADGLTYLSPEKLYRLEQQLVRMARETTTGCCVEFGVALGGSSVLIARAATAAGRQFHGFDVFGMIPPPTSEKDDAKSKSRYEKIAAGGSVGLAGQTYYGYVEDLHGKVSRVMADHGVAPVPGRIELHKGLFEDTLPVTDVGPVAFAHVDCDWYDPVKLCLSYLGERLVPAGSIVIDDYHDYEGCRTAVDEFLAARPDFRMIPGRNPILARR